MRSHLAQVQGSADLICPPVTAYDLHMAWPEMNLRIVTGSGHSMYDPGIASELVKATDRLLDTLDNTAPAPP
jgi:proline iminopeptidase